jgi:hypothetical protein
MAVEILLIEDNPGDVRLLEEAFRELRADVRLQIAKDGGCSRPASGSGPENDKNAGPYSPRSEPSESKWPRRFGAYQIESGHSPHSGNHFDLFPCGVGRSPGLRLACECLPKEANDLRRADQRRRADQELLDGVSDPASTVKEFAGDDGSPKYPWINWFSHR